MTNEELAERLEHTASHVQALRNEITSLRHSVEAARQAVERAVMALREEAAFVHEIAESRDAIGVTLEQLKRMTDKIPPLTSARLATRARRDAAGRRRVH